MMDYKKFEFCKAVECIGLRPNLDGELTSCAYYPEHCQKTAKQFHKWLNENGFFITKLDRSKGQ